MPPEQIEAYVDATAALLGLPLHAEHRPGVLRYFALAAEMAALVNGLPLAPHDDPAEAFVPISPGLNEGGLVAEGAAAKAADDLAENPPFALRYRREPFDTSGRTGLGAPTHPPARPFDTSGRAGGVASAADLLAGSAADMAAAVRAGSVSATALAEASLARIAATDGVVNAFTDVTAARALQHAAALDARIAARDAATLALPLLGVPFGVKNLFDVAGLATLAGSKIERETPAATQDGLLVARLQAAGAVLVGAQNMDEYAYGFTTENSHEGPTRNPHDPSRVAGGSSGGSTAAVAAGQVPLAIGSDTNGSIRVPSSLCGIFGLKPTYGRLPRTGSYPFVASLDHLGPFARHVADLALAYDAMQGFDAHDPGCVERPFEPCFDSLNDGVQGLRIATLSGHFHDFAGPEARLAVTRVAAALGATRTVELPEVARARAAAFVISNAQGAGLHLADLRRRAADFEPLSRDRFLAGALLPAAWVQQAQRVRRWFAQRTAELFADVDVLLAPATPVPAPLIGTEWLELNGQRLPARPSLGLLTQPISCIGLPVCAVPVWGCHATLPIGVQVIAAPWREDLVLRVAQALSVAGVAGMAQSPVASMEFA